MSLENNNSIIEQNNALIETLKTKVQNIPTGGSGDVKLFETIDEMNNSIGNKIDDLALVYGVRHTNLKATDSPIRLYFPKTVILPEAHTEQVYVSFYSDEQYFVVLDSTSFTFDFASTIKTNVTYTSTDGITYVRTDTGEDTITFESNLYNMYGEENWDEHFGYFMQTAIDSLEGLYKYQNSTLAGIYEFKKWNSDTRIYDLSSVISNIYADAGWKIDTQTGAFIKILTDKLVDEEKNIYKPVNYILYTVTNARYVDIITNGTEIALCVEASQDWDSVQTIYEYTNDVLTSNNTVTYDWSSKSQYCRCKWNTYAYWLIDEDIEDYYFSSIKTISYLVTVDTELPTSSTGLASTRQSLAVTEPLFDIYKPAETQFTAISDDVQSNSFYGAEGVSQGTLQNTTDLTKAQIKQKALLYNSFNTLSTHSGETSLNSLFYNQLELVVAPYIIFGKNLVDIGQMFYGCENIVDIPAYDTSNITGFSSCCQGCKSLINSPDWDLSKAINPIWFFANCSSLTNIKAYSIPKATSIYNYVVNCPALTDESLNNILYTLTSAVSFTGTKTLKEAGLSQEQATKCTTLSNYSAFTAAGWTTGY